MSDGIVTIDDYKVGTGNPLLLIAGPCVMESEAMIMQVAETLAALRQEQGLQIVFKSSFDTSLRSRA